MSNALLYIITVLIWGSTWLAIEFQLGSVAPEASVAYRYAGAALLLFAWCRYRRLQLRFSLAAHGRFVLLGLLLFGVNYIVAYRAQAYLTSAMTAIIFSTVLWLNIFNARIFFGVRTDARTLLGALLGVLGIGILFAPEVGEVSLADGVVYGSGLTLVGAYIASLGNMVSQAAQKVKLPIVQSNAWGMLYGATFTAAIAASQGTPFTIDLSLPYLISLAYLIVFGSIVAFGAYLTLLGRIGANRAGYAMVAFPVVALVLSVLFEGLSVGWSTIVGMALVLGGNVFVLQFKRPVPSVSTPLPAKPPSLDRHVLAPRRQRAPVLRETADRTACSSG